MQQEEMDETKPLIGSVNGSANGRSPTAEQRCWNCKAQFVGAILLVGAIAFFFPSGNDDGNGNQNVQNKIPIFPEPSASKGGSSSSSNGKDGDPVSPSMPQYRPFCLTHGNRQSTARVLQTSMGSPSQQWSHIPCYSQPEKVRRWAKSNANNLNLINLNGFGAPDAILQTNLNKAAFQDRTPILGFGAAFTEASAVNYQSLSEQGKEALMELLYGKSGLGYALGRVPINSCDFSLASYSFDDVDGDFDLKHFDTQVTHDSQKDGMMDMILRAMAVFKGGYDNGSGVDNDNDKSKTEISVEDGQFKMYASPWSPPAWMKQPTRHDPKHTEHSTTMTGSTQPSCLREGTGPHSRYAKAWALYFSKFITAYREKGVPFWAVTVQNEPEFPAPWEACSYTPEVQAEFVANHLGPQLEQDHPEVKILMFDHNKDHVITWADTILNQTNPSSQYVKGTAYHWYAGGMDRLLDGAVGTPNLHRLQHKLDALNVTEDHIILGSEACHCPYTGYAGGEIETYWSRAERYAHTILADLSAGSNGWVEWNLVLDSIGGPNHLNNLCDTTILAVPHRAINGSGIPEKFPWEQTNHSFGYNHGDARTREELNALGFPAKHLDAGLAVQPMYYYMGHISKYVRPGSRAVMGLVETSKNGLRAFRSPGQVVAGGGLNDLARNGIEVTTWPCEGSTRQQFNYNLNEKNQISVFGHDWKGNPTQSCIGAQVDQDFLGITLTPCKKTAGTYDMVEAEEEGLVKFVRTNIVKNSKGAHCLVLRKLKNDGGAYGPKGGAQVSYGDCTSPAALWKYSDSTGEIVSANLQEGEVCMTTGWPFLQIGAYETPNGESDHTVVLLNEARDSANYVLYDGEDPIVSGSIPPRSIQTVLLDSA